MYYLPISTQKYALKINWISQPFCVLGLAFGKISVGFLIIRIGVPKKWMRMLLYFFMVSSMILFAGAIIFVFAQCQPVTELWNYTEPGSCWDPEVLTMWTIVASSKSDHLPQVLFATGLPHLNH